MQQATASNKLIFDKMPKFVSSIRQKVRDDWQTIIAVTGVEGVGKSTLTIELCYGFDDNFDLIKNIDYIPTIESIIPQFNAVNQYGAFMIDEAIELFDKMDFMKDFQKTIIKMYKRERKQNKITIMCIPSFLDLSTRFRNTSVSLWISVVKRGVACIHSKYPSQYISDPWLIDENEKAFKKFFGKRKAADISAEDVLAFSRTLKTFWMEFEFPDLPNHLKDIYKEQCRIQRDKYYEDNKVTGQSISSVRRDIAHRLYENFGLTQKEIGQAFDLSQQAITKMLKQKEELLTT